MRIGIVAGEHSGDLLGARLIEAIRARVPDAVLEGIAGPQMVQAGCRAIHSAEALSVMGFVEVMGKFGSLLRIRRAMRRYFLRNPPDVFVGIDSPDFNLGLERSLRKRGIPTVHFVSPSVWAWRRYRIHSIRRSIDRMLVLFPFEEAFYREHEVDVRCVGHPLADEIPLQVDSTRRGTPAGKDRNGPVVALLPGSRAGEVRQLAGPFVEAAAWCYRQRKDLRFMVPLADEETTAIFRQALQRSGGNLPVQLSRGNAREVMTDADVVLAASGTATLEAMLLKKPMVVAYRFAPLTWWLASRLVKLPYYSLPNLLAGRKLVPEVIQHELTPAHLGSLVLHWLDATEERRSLVETFSRLHESMRGNAGQAAAEAVLGMIP